MSYDLSRPFHELTFHVGPEMARGLVTHAIQCAGCVDVIPLPADGPGGQRFQVLMSDEAMNSGSARLGRSPASSTVDGTFWLWAVDSRVSRATTRPTVCFEVGSMHCQALADEATTRGIDFAVDSVQRSGAPLFRVILPRAHALSVYAAVDESLGLDLQPDDLSDIVALVEPIA